MKQDWQVFALSARGVKVGGFVIAPEGMEKLYRRIHHNRK